MRLLLILLVACACIVHGEEVAKHPVLANDARALVGADGKKIEQERLLAPKYVLMYFSAHWCPPCRAFTPDLVTFYRNNGGGKDFEILFVSSDEDAATMVGYMKEMAMPWIGLRFGSSKTGSLQKKYGGPGIPCLTVLNDKDEVVFHSYVEGKYVGPRQVLQQFTALLQADKQAAAK